jgi:hypothetical protein
MCLSKNTILLVNNHTETLDIIRLPIPSEDSPDQCTGPKSATAGIKPCFTILLKLHLPERAVSEPDPFPLLYIYPTHIPWSNVSEAFTDHTRHAPSRPSPNASLVRVVVFVRNSTLEDSFLDCAFYVHRESLLALLASSKSVGAVDSATPAPHHPQIRKQGPYQSLGACISPKVLHWDEWGPDITHWYEIDKTFKRGSIYYGEHVVWVDQMTHEIVVRDFNPTIVKKARDVLSCSHASMEFVTPTMPIKRMIIEGHEIHSPQFFKSRVHSRLPCLETRRPFTVNAPNFVMHMDAEHLLIERFENFNVG